MKAQWNTNRRKEDLNIPEKYLEKSPEFAKLLTLTKAGFMGKNQRFIIEHFGCHICVGYLVSNAPLLGGD